MKPSSPCKECKAREAGCHAGCEKYAGYCKELEDWKQIYRAEKYDGYEADSYRIKMIRKIKKAGGEKV